MKRLTLTLLLPALAAAAAAAFLRYVWCILTNTERAWRIAVGIDQLFNVAANGSEDETVSSRASRARREGRLWGCILCNYFLDKIQKDHCKDSEGV